jgi:hydroxymethylpyrimidine pyrophosphatase-like HAD family hydrolase
MPQRGRKLNPGRLTWNWRKKAVKIAIDMDNTIIDELGSTLRPGIINFLKEVSMKHELILWTNSKRIRAMEILEYFNLRKYFRKIITRENYDPEEIEYNKNKEKTGILVESYRKNKMMKEDEWERIIQKYKM